MAEDEFALIDWIRARSRPRPGVIRGIGDDCAVVRPTEGFDLLVTTDMLMDGRHFHLEEAGPEAVGYKALGVNLSDIAAMAGIPRSATVAVALPRSDSAAIARGLHRGMMQLATEFDVALIGGDTNVWDGGLVISITVLGETTASGVVLRSGARPGDVVCVTGPLGGSRAGRHLRPRPRIREARAIHSLAPIRAMIDISDGLASDLGHILQESGNLGAEIDEDLIPIHEDVASVATTDGRSDLDHALTDGEDFELCMVLDPADFERLSRQPELTSWLIRVGTIEQEPGLRLRSAGGRIRPYEARGFNHFTS